MTVADRAAPSGPSGQAADDREIFRLGPDRGVLSPDENSGAPGRGDLRENRPYFLVPLDADFEEQSAVAARIARWVRRSTTGEPATLLLQARDVLRPGGLIARFQDAGDPGIAFLRGLLSRQTRLLLDTVPPEQVPPTLPDSLPGGAGDSDDSRPVDGETPPPEAAGGVAVFRTLLADLNGLIAGPSLYDRAAFPAEALPPDMAQRVRDGTIALARGGQRQRDNRRLVEIAVDGSPPATPPGGAAAGAAAPSAPPAPSGLAGASGGAGRSPILRGARAAGKVTDIYVLSHGWHRNFFAAVMVYDRLMSRTAVLLNRRRLRSAEPFHPLFLTLHWHSDPGKNGWVDPAGRRSKTAFLNNVAALFERPPAAAERLAGEDARFTDVFEDIFQMMGRLSAPDTATLDPSWDGEAERLSERLDTFALRDAASAGLSDKVAAAWRCYAEAKAYRPLVDQDQAPERFNSVWQAVASFTKFVLALGGIFLVLYLLSLRGIRQAGLTLWHQLERPFGVALPWPAPWANVAAVLALASALTALCWVWNQARGGRRARGKPVAALLAYVPLQIACALPLVLYCFTWYFLGGILASLWRHVVGSVTSNPAWADGPFLYNERWGRRGDDDITDAPRFRTRTETEARRRRWYVSPRLLLSSFARLPIRLLKASVAADTELPGVVNTLDNQFAFWEMQIRGVDTGIAAAAFLSHLWPQLTGCLNTEDDEGGPVRVHVIGHSFGGLVVANMARHLCLDTNNRDRAADLPVVPRLASLTLLEGAIASAWFEGERRLKRYVRDCIAAIYSAYDSANGFYYPLANGGRCAAGYVGLFRVGDKRPVLHCPVAGSPGHRGLFASLVSSPGLRRLLDEHLGKIPHDTNADGLPYVVNLDASRMIFDGPVSAGGGHADIFKDDVVHLLWEVTRLRPRAAIVPAPPVLTVPRKVAARLREVLVGRPLP